MNRNTFLTFVMLGLAASWPLGAQQKFTLKQMDALRKNQAAVSARLIGVVSADTDPATTGAKPRAADPSANSFAGDVVIPMLANGYYGNDQVVAGVQILNTAGRAVAISVEFFDHYGYRHDMPIAASDGSLDGHYQMLTGVLPKEGMTSFFTFPDTSTVQVTYARVHSDMAGAIRVMVNTYRIADSYWFYAAGLAPDTPSQRMYYVLNDDEYAATFQIVNTSIRSTTVILRALDFDGTELCRSYSTVLGGDTLLMTPATRDTCNKTLAPYSHILAISADSQVLAVDNIAITKNTFTQYTAYPAQ